MAGDYVGGRTVGPAGVDPEYMKALGASHAGNSPDQKAHLKAMEEGRKTQPAPQQKPSSPQNKF
jgi:hypothetical protein